MDPTSLTQVFSPEDAAQLAQAANQHGGYTVEAVRKPGSNMRWLIRDADGSPLVSVHDWSDTLPAKAWHVTTGTSPVFTFDDRDDALDLAFYLADLLLKVAAK